MIAEIYPLRRVPRKFDHFDYVVPDGIKISRGQFVEIPFRNDKCAGVVKSVKEKPLRGMKLKSVISVFESVVLREQELDFLESVARAIAQPVSSLLYVVLPKPTNNGK